MNGFDSLGAEVLKAVPRQLSWGRTALAVTAGALAAALCPKHPVLAALGAAAAVSNTHAVVQGDRTIKSAIQRMGKHVVATVASLSVPKYPGMGYVAGAVAADLFIDGEGGGILEEFAEFEGIRDVQPRKDVIDVEFVENQNPGQQLAKIAP